MNKLFEFKTIDKYFHFEKDGSKNNIIRKIDLQDDRFLDLIAHNQLGYGEEDLFIKILNKQTGESFTREITNITIFENFIIITWKV